MLTTLRISLCGFYYTLFLLWSFTLFAQPSSKGDGVAPLFVSPVGHRIRLSGTFGELRPNHFHAGIDIKSSNGRAGDPAFAMEDGYISRIKIQSGGYGNALYITYPGGWTALYAHLNTFSPEVMDWVRKRQYEMQSFEVNLYPLKNQFKVYKGQQVGTLGNSGYSFGPHLHLELRRQNGNVPFNPLEVLPFIRDTIPPVFQAVLVEGLTSEYQVIAERNIGVEGTAPRSFLPADTLELPAWRAGISLRVYDRINGSSNKNGIYKIQLYVDDREVYRFMTSRCSFKETRYVNAHMNYAKQVLLKQYWHRCYILPGNHLSMYPKHDVREVFDLYTHRVRKIRVELEDAAGNSNQLQFYIRRQPDIPEPKFSPFNYKLVYDRDNYLTWAGASLHIPKGALYRNEYLSVAANNKGSLPFFQIGEKGIPLHKYCNLSFKSLDIAPEMRDKAILAMRDKDKRLSYGGRWVKGQFRCRIRQLGAFFIALDTVPPEITPRRIRSAYHVGETLSFEVKDNFMPAGKAKALRFVGRVDGEWILVRYDLKRNLLLWTIDAHTPPGKHIFTLAVTDDRDNQRIYTKEIKVLP